MLRLERIKRTDERLLDNMAVHYSQPKGFVGRNICYAVMHNNRYYGAIVGGSSTLHLAGRDEFFGLNSENKQEKLKNIVNNIFFHIERVDGRYPFRWFSARVLSAFRETIKADWHEKYRDTVIGYETLIELPRRGDCYKKDKWHQVGVTKGFTCKRQAGKGSDSWTGKRVWDTQNLRPKLVFVRHI